MHKRYAAVNSYLDTKCEDEHDEYDTPEVQQAQREFEASLAIAPELDNEESGGLME